MLELGSEEEHIVRQALNAQLPIPDTILNAPILLPGLELYLEAYLELGASRHSPGQGIPWESVQGYAMANEFDAEQIRLLHFYTQKLDQTWIEHVKQETDK